MNNKLPSSKILGVNINTGSKGEILDFIITGLKRKEDKFYIVTPNPEMIVAATRSSSFKTILNNAQVSLPDGIGVLIAGNILKKGLKERITGIDLMLDICKECARSGLSIGLLGGTSGVAEKTAECLTKKYPDLRVSYAVEEWVNTLQDKSCDILFVAFGFPKQEEWISKNLPKIPVTAAMGIGGAFDFISGKVPRAPQIIQKIGMEWAFRLVIQPWRIKRQLALPVFAFKVLKGKMSR